MQTFDFIDYIKMRVKRPAADTPMGDLVGDLKSELRTLEELGTFTKIYDHVAATACSECLDVFRKFRTQYRQYCRRHDMLPEELLHI